MLLIIHHFLISYILHASLILVIVIWHIVQIHLVDISLAVLHLLFC